MNSYERIQKAIDYIEKNLTDKIELEKAASEACFSLPHFYRVFHALAGHTVKEYIRKRRLSEAAERLVGSNDRLIDVSFDCQFEYQESFTRAFKNMFGESPGRYRKRSRATGLFGRLDLIDRYFILGEESTNRSLPSVRGQKYPERRNQMSETMDVRIVSLDPMRVAYYRAVSEHPENDAWKVLIAWAREKGLPIGENGRLFGFNNPNPSKDNPVYGYEVWMTVERDVEATGGIKIKDFPGGLYAVAQTKLPQITSAWKRLVGWCKASEYSDACHQWLEESLTPPGTPFDDVVIDMYLPIEE